MKARDTHSNTWETGPRKKILLMRWENIANNKFLIIKKTILGGLGTRNIKGEQMEKSTLGNNKI